MNCRTIRQGSAWILVPEREGGLWEASQDIQSLSFDDCGSVNDYRLPGNIPMATKRVMMPANRVPITNSSLR